MSRRAHAIAVLLLAQSIAVAARGELAWPELCARVDGGVGREPDEVRRYLLRMNDRPAGTELFRLWREGGRIRVVIKTELEGDIGIFPADFRHCRDEWWREQADGLQLVELESAINYAIPFKPDYQIQIARDPERDEVVYRTRSVFGAAEERFPPNTGAITPWSVRTVDHERLLDLFEYGVYRIDSRIVGRATVDGDEVVHYALAGEWPRHLWYDADGKMIRFCAEVVFGTYIETIFEPYADLGTAAAELDRSCAEVFQ